MNSKPSIPQMALQELRIRVAELCGWTAIHQQSDGLWCGTSLSQEILGHQIKWESFLPDYCNDLNACHEFEELLKTLEQRNLFYAHLYRDCMVGDVMQHGWRIANATAEQRCRAFIATMEAPSVEPKRPKSDRGSEFSKSVSDL